MKKNRLIIIILSVFILTGCSIEYNLDITGNEFIENINVIDLVSEDRNKETILDDHGNYFSVFYRAPNPGNMSEFVNTFHTKTINELENGYRINYTFNFSESNIRYARSINKAFNSFIVRRNSNLLLISTDNRLRLFDSYTLLTQVVVNIKTDYEITNHNADSVNGNVYTWVFNRDNYTDKSIQLEGVPNRNNEQNNNQIVQDPEESIFDSPLVVFLGFLGFLIAIGVVIKIRSKFNEE